MQTRRFLIKAALTGATFGSLTTRLWAAGKARNGIISATAITQVFGDGQKLVAIRLRYDRPVRSTGVNKGSFAVDGRTITDVFVSRSDTTAARASSGNFVTLTLSPDEPAASLKLSRKMGPPAGSSAGSGVAAGPSGPPSAPPRGMGELGKALPGGPMQTYKPAIATIIQSGPIAPVKGKTWAASSAPYQTDAVENRVVDTFVQRTFRDPESALSIQYNLFVPKAYRAGVPLPLVLFMADASVTGDDPLLTLKQGLGAIVWAQPTEQAKRPCIVVAPQFNEIIANDDSQTSPARETVYALLQALQREFSVDPMRLYCTGQSGGAMMTIALNIKHPDLFAASYIVAGQWSADLIQPIAKKKLWIMVAEGDLKAFPGQNAITAAMEQQGAKIARATWDGRWNAAQFETAVADILVQAAAINYTVLAKGTVVPVGETDNGGSNHMNTWRIAYVIEGIRDWLFRQRK